MRCLILGGYGFLGRHVGRAFASEGFDVASVDVSQLPTHDHDWISHSFAAEFYDVNSWWHVFPNPDLIIHLASSTVPASATLDPILDVNSNLCGTLRLLDELRSKKFSGKLIFASSGGAVYGMPVTVPLNENHPTNPIGAYGVTKLAIEHHIRIAKTIDGLDYRILRISNPYGEGQLPSRAQGVIGVFSHQALSGKPIDIWGDGKVVRDFIYASDVATAFVAAYRHSGSSRVFNIGGGEGLSINEIIEALSRILQVKLQRRFLPPRPFDPPVNVLDTSLAKAELGWAPTVKFDKGLENTLTWLRGLMVEPLRAEI